MIGCCQKQAKDGADSVLLHKLLTGPVEMLLQRSQLI